MTASELENSRFDGRKAIITGGGRGIGKAIASDLAGRGAMVHLVSQSPSATEAAREIQATGGKAQAYIGSVADESFCRAVVEQVAGGPDILVNAAATLGPFGPMAEFDMQGFQETIAVNLFGPANFMRWALPGMQARGFGRVINFAGGGAAYSYPLFAGYAASKVAVVRLTETVADEVTPGVTVNVIAPGAVATDMLAEVRRRGGEVRTVVDIAEPVRLVRFLASDASKHVNGRFIHARDNYLDASLFTRKDAFKLRRIDS